MADGSLPVMIVGFDGLMHLEQDFTTDYAKVAARAAPGAGPHAAAVGERRARARHPHHRRRHHAALPCRRRLGDPRHQHHGQHLHQRPGLCHRGAPRDRPLGRRPHRVRQRAGRPARAQGGVRGGRRRRDASARGADHDADALAVAARQRLGARRRDERRLLDAGDRRAPDRGRRSGRRRFHRRQESGLRGREAAAGAAALHGDRELRTAGRGRQLGAGHALSDPAAAGGRRLDRSRQPPRRRGQSPVVGHPGRAGADGRVDRGPRLPGGRERRRASSASRCSTPAATTRSDSRRATRRRASSTASR